MLYLCKDEFSKNNIKCIYSNIEYIETTMRIEIYEKKLQNIVLNIYSFYEIYGGKLYDLVAERKQILVRDDGKQKVNIIGLKRIKCENVEVLMDAISRGNAARQTGSTGANNASSRSHAILAMDILPIRGRLSFIDLAGSERGADIANNNKQTRFSVFSSKYIKYT